MDPVDVRVCFLQCVHGPVEAHVFVLPAAKAEPPANAAFPFGNSRRRSSRGRVLPGSLQVTATQVELLHIRLTRVEPSELVPACACTVDASGHRFASASSLAAWATSLRRRGMVVTLAPSATWFLSEHGQDPLATRMVSLAIAPDQFQDGVPDAFDAEPPWRLPAARFASDPEQYKADVALATQLAGLAWLPTACLETPLVRAPFQA